MSTPIYRGPVTNIAGKVCQCSVCGIVARCSADFDFYIRRPGPDDGPLYCYSCLCAAAKLRPALAN